MGTLDAHLLAINVETGKVVWNTTVADAMDRSCQNPQRPNRPEFAMPLPTRPS